MKKTITVSKSMGLVIACSTLIVLELAILFSSYGQPGSLSDATLGRYASQVVDACAKERYTPSCYDKEIPKLMDKISMEQAFQVASVVQTRDSSYGYCHVLGHELSAKEAAKDPARWKDVIRRCPQGLCSNGCLHGAAQERFRGETLNDSQLAVAEKELVGVCDKTGSWVPTGLEASECFHGLGHLTMYITGASLTKSLSICDTIAIAATGQSYNTLCYEGAFMQLFQPLDEEDKVLVEGKAPVTKEQLSPFCKQFGPDSRVEACWREGLTLYRPGIDTATGTVQYCSNPIVKNRGHCYNMLYYANAQGANYDPVKLSAYCNAMPTFLQPDCFGNIANAIIHGGNRLIDQAVAFCTYGASQEVLTGCYRTIVDFADYNLLPGSKSFDTLCRALPAPYGNQCFKKGR
ncbi:MAG: hypothetical protein Q7S95_03625 [bacterium]|nr:hypothetical protein [bacterium]